VSRHILSPSRTVGVIEEITVWRDLAIHEPRLPIPSRAAAAFHSTVFDAEAAAFAIRTLLDVPSSERRRAGRSAEEGVSRSGEPRISVQCIPG